MKAETIELFLSGWDSVTSLWICTDKMSNEGRIDPISLFVNDRKLNTHTEGVPLLLLDSEPRSLEISIWISSRCKIPYKVDCSRGRPLREIHHQVRRVVVWHPADRAGDQGQSAISRWVCVPLWITLSLPSCRWLLVLDCVRAFECAVTVAVLPWAKKSPARCIMYMMLCIMQCSVPRGLWKHVKGWSAVHNEVGHILKRHEGRRREKKKKKKRCYH